MLDAHCHIDLYADPMKVALDAERAGVFTILVTNLPSAFQRSYPHTRELQRIRIALGLHPLTAEKHAAEFPLFQELLPKTSYIGEVGLDFSVEGAATKEQQIRSFEFVLQSLGGQPKFLTVHSRKAEKAVLDLLFAVGRSPAVFHWYTGPLNILDLALEKGHFFSINPAMFRSERGRSIVSRIPPERVLTESDGPFVRVGNRQIVPADVRIVEKALSDVWRTEVGLVRRTIMQNFQRLIEPLKADRFGNGIDSR